MMETKTGQKRAVLARIPRDSWIFLLYARRIRRALKDINWKHTNKIYTTYPIKLQANTRYNQNAINMLRKAFDRIGWDLCVNHYILSGNDKVEYSMEISRKF